MELVVLIVWQLILGGVTVMKKHADFVTVFVQPIRFGCDNFSRRRMEWNGILWRIASFTHFVVLAQIVRMPVKYVSVHLLDSISRMEKSHRKCWINHRDE
jgi:hypothetical protein